MADSEDRPVISKTEAQRSGLKYYFNGCPCDNGHFVERYVIGNACVLCRKYQKAFWYSRNKALSKMRGDRWKKVINPKRHREWKRYYYEENKDRFISDTKAARMRRRRAMPLWVNVKEIRKIYYFRAKISRETGILHHVDHIVPLGGKDVCGLHVPWNLQVISAIENQKKFNSFYGWDGELCVSRCEDELT